MLLDLKRFRCLVGAFALFFLAAGLHAQQITGSIAGIVKDAQGAVISNARVTLVSQEQGSSRDMKSGGDGGFVFTPVLPGTYRINVEAAGFKKYEQTDVKIFANDRLFLPDIMMQVGSLTESVTVEASAAMIQATSAERSGVITSSQVVDLALTTRDFLALTKTVPGWLESSGLGGKINGGRDNANNLTVDGVTNVDTGSNGGVLATVNIDMIAEYKVITNGQQAEFGRSSGAQINVVTKSGTKDFHGGGYIFHRHEGLNANKWRNNVDNRARQIYRYNFAGFNVGGPAYIPGHWNKEKEKLFFFVGLEWQNQLAPNSLRNVLLPSALDRQGNFSQSKEPGGNAVRVIDPTTGATFPNMTIPASRINADGQKILNWYPKPNAEGISADYNYQTQISNSSPRRERMFRGDYVINDKWRAYARFMNTYSQTNMFYGQWNADYNIPLSAMNFGNPGWSFITNVTTIINPTLTNEFIFGSSKNNLNIDPIDQAFSRDKLGLSYKMPFPDADKLNLVQNWRYSFTNSPFTGFNGTPFRNFNHTYDYTDNVSKLIGPHTLKAGIFLQRSAKDQTAFTSVNGNMYFNRDSANPADTNWDYANAIMGTFQRLQQSNVVLNGQYRYWNVEWYVQDNWRVNNKLTIDYGIRFYYIQPQYDQAHQTSSFNPSLYDPKNSAVLAQVGINPANGQRASYNPITGQYGPAALIGAIINTGNGFVNGLYANGMGLSGQNYPEGLIDGAGIKLAPRIGIAYRFDPKTVIRFGGGVFRDRFQGNPVFDMLPNPPSTNSPQFYYGNLAAIPPASAGIYFPANVNGFDKHGEIPTTYNYNFTVQRELPFSILMDVGYVGSIANHIIYRYNKNAAPLGSAWLPVNQDPTKTPLYDGTTAKPVNFYRPYAGYADSTVVGFGANSNYHSMQLAVNRRMGRDLTFGVAYTWSKVLGTTTDDYTSNNPFNTRVADYGPMPYDHTHTLVFNYVYNLPKFVKGDSTGEKFAKQIVNGWQVSGITTMQTGSPTNISFAVTGWGNLNERYTGSPNIGPRVVYTGPTAYPKDQYAWFSSNQFALPALKSSQGFDSAIRPLRLPGDHNWDVSVYKNFQFTKVESRYIQLRLEMFNAPNHPRFSSVNTSATFDTSGKLINLPTALGGNGGRFGFGSLTDTRDPRIIQLAAKIYF